MAHVIPAIIPTNLEEIESKISLVQALVKKVQLDFVDGKYAPPLTWPFNVESKPDRIKFADELVLEGDLFIKYPEDFVQDFLDLGIKSFVFHIDSTNYLDKCIHLAREGGAQVGLGVKPSGDFKLLKEFMTKVDFIQFMGNDKVGYNGVELDRRVLHHISDFHTAYPFLPIQIDIGVNERTAPDLIRAGATGLVSSSAVFAGGNIEENIKNLKYGSTVR